MTAREAQDARYKIGLTLESSYHSGYEKPLELGGAVFLCVCLSYFGGWRSSVGDYTEMVGHTGDAEAAGSKIDAVELRGFFLRTGLGYRF
mgnify:CR=1 FL=1